MCEYSFQNPTRNLVVFPFCLSPWLSRTVVQTWSCGPKQKDYGRFWARHVSIWEPLRWKNVTCQWQLIEWGLGNASSMTWPLLSLYDNINRLTESEWLFHRKGADSIPRVQDQSMAIPIRSLHSQILWTKVIWFVQPTPWGKMRKVFVGFCLFPSLSWFFHFWSYFAHGVSLCNYAIWFCIQACQAKR